MYTERYVTHLLETLGISRCYNGHSMAVEAVLVVLQDEETLRNIRRQVYARVAVRRQSSWCCVERDMRTVIRRAWQINAALLRRMAPYPLDEAPTVKEFIEIVALYTLRHAPAEVIEEIGRAQLCPV